jgi:hypothetical protein
MATMTATSITAPHPQPPGWSSLDGLPMAYLAPPPIWDDGLFVIRRDVPILDAHRHLDKGTVDRCLLELIARNSNARSADGDFALLTIGHTDPGVQEIEQPPIVGYVAKFAVGQYLGRPCLLADFHYKRSKFDLAMSFPHRSVERMTGTLPQSNFIDSIALLRTAPERPLGLVTYSRPVAAVARDKAAVTRPSTTQGESRAAGMDRIREQAADEARAIYRYARDNKIDASNWQDAVSGYHASPRPTRMAPTTAQPAHLPLGGQGDAVAAQRQASEVCAQEAAEILRYSRQHKLGPEDAAKAVEGWRAERIERAKRPH